MRAVTRASVTLSWLERLLLAAGLLLLAYCGYVLNDRWSFQRETGEDFARRRLAAQTAGTEPGVEPDGLVGRIEIPRIRLSAMVYEGTDRQTLHRAVGHVRQTALPGQRGNTGLAGHRDSFFRPLQSVRRGDIITVLTLRGEYRYRVMWLRVVPAAEVSVLEPTRKEESLTLVTCHPFQYVGAAPNRFIVRAKRLR